MINSKAKKLGEGLVTIGVLTEEQLEIAMSAASDEDSPSLIACLLEKGYLTFKVFEKFVAATLGIQSAIVANRPFSKEAVDIIGSEILKTHLIYPFAVREEQGKRTIALGMVDPTDDELISALQVKSGCRIIPVLISLSDFKEAMKNNIQVSGVEIDTSGKEEEFVVVHTGGREVNTRGGAEGTDDKLHATITKTVQPKPGWNQKTVLSNLVRDSGGDFVGRNNKKFREEILAKLDLDPADAQHLQEAGYTRDTLLLHLKNVTEPKLQKIYNTLSTELKLEALINTLLKNGTINKHDFFVSAAVSLAFNEEKKP